MGKLGERQGGSRRSKSAPRPPLFTIKLNKNPSGSTGRLPQSKDLPGHGLPQTKEKELRNFLIRHRPSSPPPAAAPFLLPLLPTDPPVGICLETPAFSLCVASFLLRAAPGFSTWLSAQLVPALALSLSLSSLLPRLLTSLSPCMASPSRGSPPRSPQRHPPQRHSCPLRPCIHA